MSDSLPPPATDAAPCAAPVSATAVPAVGPDDDVEVIDLTPRVPDDYNPADYRWVPVRRRPRHDGWTEEKQRRFIEVLADTGQVGLAAREVGMTRETAYRLRRSAHGAAFARAWDAARHHAGSLLEDVAFDRAIEGVEQHLYDDAGEVIASRRVYNDRLLTFLLRNLKPERYGRAGRDSRVGANAPPSEAEPGAEAVTVEACLRDMEPALPAPPEELLDDDQLNVEVHLAEVCDGVLPHFLREQRPQKSPERLKAEANAARYARGKALCERLNANPSLKFSPEENRDLYHYLDPNPGPNPKRARKRFR
jgi:hypothetical protein